MVATMTDAVAQAALDLDELEAVAKAASPGPYRACSCSKCGLVWLSDKETLLAASGHEPGGDECGGVQTVGVSAGVRNRDFIAAFNPTVALALITELRALRAERGWVHSSVRKPKQGDSICFIWGDRGIAGTVQEDGKLHRWSSAYPVDDAEEYTWCLLPGIPGEPLPQPPGVER